MWPLGRLLSRQDCANLLLQLRPPHIEGCIQACFGQGCILTGIVDCCEKLMDFGLVKCCCLKTCERPHQVCLVAVEDDWAYSTFNYSGDCSSFEHYPRSF